MSVGASREGDMSVNSEEEEVKQPREREEDNSCMVWENQVGKVGINTKKDTLSVREDYMV